MEFPRHNSKCKSLKVKVPLSDSRSNTFVCEIGELKKKRRTGTKWYRRLMLYITRDVFVLLQRVMRCADGKYFNTLIEQFSHVHGYA